MNYEEIIQQQNCNHVNIANIWFSVIKITDDYEHEMKRLCGIKLEWAYLYICPCICLSLSHNFR